MGCFWREMCQINSPGEDTNFLAIKAQLNRLIGGAMGISDQAFGALQRKAGAVFAQFVDLYIVHQVKTPAH